MVKKDKFSELKFEAALHELETIVTQLEEKNPDLETSLTLFENGMRLAKHCESILSQAKGKIEKISKDFADNEITVALTSEDLKHIDLNDDKL